MHFSLHNLVGINNELDNILSLQKKYKLKTDEEQAMNSGPMSNLQKKKGRGNNVQQLNDSCPGAHGVQCH